MPEQPYDGPTKTIEELVLEQHERQERFTYRDYALMVMSTQQELGQLTTDLLPLFKFRTLPEKWDDAWQNWQNTQQLTVTSAVARAARFIEMAEYVSTRTGWSCTPEEVIRLVFSNWKYSPGDWQEPYLKLCSEVGMMAHRVVDSPRHADTMVSSDVRRMVFYSFELIYRIQNKS